jgi:hypothetical protein
VLARFPLARHSALDEAPSYGSWSLGARGAEWAAVPRRLSIQSRQNWPPTDALNLVAASTA